MNFIAKHFFDYQSFINLPHTAVQMHKMPPSQAGTDPSAAWAPKDLHVAGKNQAAPGARANRSYHHGEQRTGSHRHGRPSKLEFRIWGERHGELRAEKNVPHTDHWMEVLQGGHPAGTDDAVAGGGSESLASTPTGPCGSGEMHPHQHFSADYFPRLAFQQQQQKSLVQCPSELLLILTLTPHLDFVSITAKSVRGILSESLPSDKEMFIQVRLFDGLRLLEERNSAGHRPRAASEPQSQFHQQKQGPFGGGNPHLQQQQQERLLGHSFLLRAPSLLRLPFCHLTLSLHSGSIIRRKEPVCLGNCVIGPSGSVSRGHFHWRQMIKKIGVPIAMWHQFELDNQQPQPSYSCHGIGRTETIVDGKSQQQRRRDTVGANS